MNDNLKRHLISALTTFLSVFLVALGTTLSNGVPMEGAAIVSILTSAAMVGVRAAIKVAVESQLGKADK